MMGILQRMETVVDLRQEVHRNESQPETLDSFREFSSGKVSNSKTGISGT
jgi:hypothetical protein